LTAVLSLPLTGLILKTGAGDQSELTGGYLKLTPKENRRLETIFTAEIRSRLEAVVRKLQRYGILR
jgi:hypothetical protein